MRRILVAGGILVVTTQRKAFLRKLTPGERKRLGEEGVLTRDFPVRDTG